jgi:hypothetical protein
MRHRPTARLVLLVLATALFLLPLGAAATKRRAFVTSATGTGDLATWAGVAGATALERADSICRYHAAGGQLPNWSTYRAWISVSGTDAYCHVQGLSGTKASGCNGAPLPGGGPWYLANGITPWSGTLDQMTGPEALFYRPVTLDENLDPISSLFDERLFWTDTDRQGQGIGTMRCDEWTSAEDVDASILGDAHGVGARFTAAASIFCSGQGRLLCLEPGASETVTPRWAPGALAFVSSASGTGDLGSWPAADGLAGIFAGFRICQNLAAAAHLPAPSSFVPWLSTTFVDAVDRLTTDGPFRRPDGLAVANDVAGLVGLSFTMNSLHQQENGLYIGDGFDRVWTGTLTDGTEGPFLCDNWTNGATGQAMFGTANVGRVAEWTESSSNVCESTQRLYCFSNVITLFWDGFESGTLERWTSATP